MISNTLCQNTHITTPVAPRAAMQTDARASVGLARTCREVYDIASDMLGLTEPRYHDTPLYHASDGRFSDHDSRFDLCEARLEQAKKHLLSCPEGQNLWDGVESEGPFTVRCAAASEVVRGAMLWAEQREILISEKNDEMVKGLLFELNNLKRAEMASLIGRKKCSLEVDTFAIVNEAIEYGTAKDTYTISNTCVSGGFWPPNFRQYQEKFDNTSDGENWNSFEGYLATQEKWAHTDLYRRLWYQNCDPDGLAAWTAKNMAKWQALRAELLARDEHKDEL